MSKQWTPGSLVTALNTLHRSSLHGHWGGYRGLKMLSQSSPASCTLDMETSLMRLSEMPSSVAHGFLGDVLPREPQGSRAPFTA